MLLVIGSRLLPVHASASDAAALEYKVKAGYLFNFAKLVEWPAAALPGPGSPFIIGVLDDGEAQPVIQALLEEKTVKGHPVRVRSFAAEGARGAFHILFVTRAVADSPSSIRAALEGAPTLLVGETQAFAQRGGIINFVNVEGRVKFEVNNAAAGDVRLVLGSQLLKLAIVVGPGSGPRQELK